LTLPLSACVSDLGPTLSGPVLSVPPPAVVTALTHVAHKDPSAAAWFIDLDNYYRKTGR
jgi:hypothetical protein